MQAMQRLIRVPEVAQTMQNMSKEMMKAGIIEEMLDETMDTFEDTEEMEEAAQTEVDKVLWEITEGKLGEAPAPPVGERPAVEEPAEPAEVEDEEEIEEMQSRLAALKS
jgi:charged multivesicular body protein 3